MPPASLVRLDSAVVPPTAPEKVVAPVPLTVSARAPSTVPPKLIAPVPASMATFDPSVVAPPILNPPLPVV